MTDPNSTSFRRFIVIWIGQFVSSIGSGLTAFALGIYAYQTTHTATSFSLVVLCSFVPSIVFRPFGGVLADRFDRRRMMMLGDLGSIAGIAFVLAVILTGTVQLWLVYLGVTVSSVFVAIQSPAYKASLTDLLTEEQFAKASGLVQLSSSAQYLLSPIIAGFLLSVTDISTVLMIDIFSFVIAILAVLAVRKGIQSTCKKAESGHFIFEMVGGWRAISTNTGVLLLVAIISVTTFYIGFLQTLLGPMILAFSDSKTFGTTMSISAIGMLVSSVFISTVLKSERYVDLLAVGLGGAGVFFILTGLTTNIYFITASGFFFFCALPFVNTSADVLVRRNIANEKQGRAWGIIGVLSQIGFVVSYAVAGFLADRVFNPLLEEGGSLASTVGKIIGTGPGRGIGLLFIISGMFVVALAAISSRLTALRSL